MADFWRTWEQFKRKADAERLALTLFDRGAQVTPIRRGETGYRDGFRWAVEVTNMKEEN